MVGAKEVTETGLKRTPATPKHPASAGDKDCLPIFNNLQTGTLGLSDGTLHGPIIGLAYGTGQFLQQPTHLATTTHTLFPLLQHWQMPTYISGVSNIRVTSIICREAYEMAYIYSFLTLPCSSHLMAHSPPHVGIFPVLCQRPWHNHQQADNCAGGADVVPMYMEIQAYLSGIGLGSKDTTQPK